MADTTTTTKPKPKAGRALLYILGGGVALYFVGRALGRSDEDEFEAMLAAHGLERAPAPPPVDSQLADSAAHASSLSTQLYALSRQLRD